MSRTSKPNRSPWRSLLLALGVFTLACEGPRGASPLPEPPAIDGSRIGFGNALVPASLPSDIEIAGDTASASPGATLRVTNLDTADDPVTTTVGENGRFSALIAVSPGDELRFEAFRDQFRSDPVDLVVVEASLEPAPRHDCVALTPGYVVELDAGIAESLTIANQCDAPLVVQDPRARLALPDFELTTPELPVTIDPRRTTTLRFTFTPESPPPVEDIVFLDLAQNGETLRYPITLAPTH